MSRRRHFKWKSFWIYAIIIPIVSITYAFVLFVLSVEFYSNRLFSPEKVPGSIKISADSMFQAVPYTTDSVFNWEHLVAVSSAGTKDWEKRGHVVFSGRLANGTDDIELHWSDHVLTITLPLDADIRCKHESITINNQNIDIKYRMVARQ